jgi:hypothetical protein
MSTVEPLAPVEPEVDMGSAREVIREHVVSVIRELHGQAGGLSRVHRTHPALYAQARRAFGTWRAAVAAAGIDYTHELHQSLRRGLLLRDQRRALWHALSRVLAEQPGLTDARLAEIRPELASRIRRCWGSVAEAVAWAQKSRGGQRDIGEPPQAAHAASES